MVKTEYPQPRLDNLHEASELITGPEIEALEQAFLKAWCEETLLPAERADFDESDPSYSQCYVTAMVVQTLLGGEIVEGVIPQDPDNFHAWNRLPDGSMHDFDRIQFPRGFEFEIVKLRTLSSILMSPRSIQAETARRFETLLSRVLEELPEELREKWGVSE